LGEQDKSPPDKNPTDISPWTKAPPRTKAHPDKKPPNIEIIIQAYYICFILMVILKDILKN
jgi:hypothetical protein